MKSSGISFKRGLAATAIAALAITGTPFLASSASADTVGQQVTGVQLYNASAVPVSAKNDGTDTLVRLEAGAQTSVNAVNFEYSLDGVTFQTIALNVARNDDGAFAYDWNVTSLVGATGVTIRASDAATGSVLPADVATGVSILGGGSAPATVNLTDGSALGVFQSPYGSGQNVILTGTSSDTTPGSTTNLNVVDGAGAGAANGTADNTTAQGATSSTFKGVLDITGYNYGATDQLVVEADAGANLPQDFESYTLYKQTITTVTATPANANVPAGQSTTVTVTVTDQNGGKPIAGARVSPSDGSSPAAFTDENGQVTFTQVSGTTTYYYADTTTATGYQAGVDVKSTDVALGAYTPAPTTLVAKSADGNAFDLDENVPGDITVQVNDQKGNPFTPGTGQDLNYYFVVTPFDGTAPVRFPLNTASPNYYVSTDNGDGTADGKYDITLPANAPSGSYQLFASLEADGLGNGAVASSNVLTFKAGQAKVTNAPAGDQTAAAGGQVSITGTLALEDGTTLAGRSVTEDYTRGNNGSDPVKDAGIVPATGNTLVLTRTYTTGANGTFTVVVDDLAETPQGTELGGSLVASAPALAYTGNAVGIDFASFTPPAGATVTINPDTNTYYPGQTIGGSATVLTADPDGAGPGVGSPIEGQIVTLTVDKGFFTDGNDTTSTTDPDGSQNSLTKSITRTTDVNGQVFFQTTDERDAGLDDDGKSVQTVTATVGSASDTEDYAISTLNDNYDYPGVITISGPTAATATGSSAALNVSALDSFGNPIGDHPVTLSDNSNTATITVLNTFSDYTNCNFFQCTLEVQPGVVRSNFNSGPDATITDSKPETVIVTGTDYYNNGFQSGTTNVTFYDASVANATATLTHSPASPAVGATVTETLTVLDSQGNPISGATVNFLRSGPGSETGNGDANATTTTNSAGQAFYSFQGNAAGTATITAVITGDGSQTVTDTVTFTGDTTPPPTTEPVRVVARLSAPNNGGQDDVLKVTTKPIAPNATVRFYKVIDGKKIFLDSVKLGKNGFARYVAQDKNGRNFTKYFATVSHTSTTKAARTNSKFTR